MKRYALNTLVCPFTGSDLSLVSFEETPILLTNQDVERCDRLGIDAGEASSAVKEGILYSEQSRKWFPIVNYTPIMLDFPTGMHDEFRQRHGSESKILTDFEMVDGTPREGELFIQRSFTREWDLLDLDNISFGYTPELRDEFVKLELDWPLGLLERGPLKILEVGAGSGFETASLERVTEGVVFGFDLNLALVRKGHLLFSNAFVNTAISSLFRLPLRPRSFPMVYSSGVLHHTYSTKDAFDSIEQFRTEDGVIYIWVYALEDFNKTANATGWYLVELFLRPRIARLRDRLQNLAVKVLTHLQYRYVDRRPGAFGFEKWTWKDSEHLARDRWTPLFAHRHSFKELMMWFEDKGLIHKFIDGKSYGQTIGMPLTGIGIRGAPQSYFAKLAENINTEVPESQKGNSLTAAV